MAKSLLCIGYGFSAQALAFDMQQAGWNIEGTTRCKNRVASMEKSGVRPIIWPGDNLHQALTKASHLLISAAPNAQGDPFLNKIDISNYKFSWVGYLSTTGVYGNHNGAWVDETSSVMPTTKRGQWRNLAEKAWSRTNAPLHIFRLAGIYGPGRGPFSKVKDGSARRIIKPGQMFSRIHVEDISQILTASIKRPRPGAIYNVCDDEPAPPQDVIAYAAQLLSLPLPPEIPFDNSDMSPMARSFYSENKCVQNTLMKSELGITLKYPNYRVGLQSLLVDEY